MTGSTGSRTERDAARTQAVGRITVALIFKAAEDLQRLQERTGLSKTDIVNRAITLYRFIDGELGDDDDLLVRNKKTGEVKIVKLL